MDYLCNVIYDVLMEPYDEGAQQILKERWLYVPLGVHPDQTESAKAKRGSTLRALMGERQ